MIKLQAHRGVCTEYPENTMAAFLGAICQGYEVIELDPAVTADGVFVVLHDKSINRTAREWDGGIINEEIKIADITYNQAAAYDYGAWFSLKYKGEKLPLLRDVLQLAKEHDILLKLDNKIWGFPEKYMPDFWGLLRESEARLAVTCNSVSAARKTLKEVPDAEIHYDGEVNEEVLQKLRSMTDQLTVWLPYESERTSWVQVPFASEALCKLVRKYAKLGIWIVDRYEDFDDISKRFTPDIVETPGQVKPRKNVGCKVDLHTHSKHSHDSVCPIPDMAKWQQDKGMYAFAVTDHCDVLYCQEKDVITCIRESVAEVEKLRETIPADILSGVEMGEGTWYPQVTRKVLDMCEYDVVLASVHTVKYKQYDKPYSGIDFSAMDREEIHGFLEQYFQEVLETLRTIPCDVAAHLTVPLRYINGKYNLNVDCGCCEEKLREILEFLIQHGIALELNTSGMGEGHRDWMEQECLLKMYRDMGGFLITVGSDAHVCENAGKEFDQAYKLLQKYGFRNWFYFEKRRSIQCSLN